MRKNQINATLTEAEIQRNKRISKVRYKIEQYFGITHKYHGAGKTRFTTIVKENWDHLCGAMAFNIKCVTLTLRKQRMIAVTWGEASPKTPLRGHPGINEGCQRAFPVIKN